MEKWVIFGFINAILKGGYQCANKKSIERNNYYEVLATFSLMSLILIVVTNNNFFDIKLNEVLFIFVKSMILVIAWFLNLYAIGEMPVSLYGIINLSRIIFAIGMSVVILGEQLTLTSISGILIVILGLVLVNEKEDKNEKRKPVLKQ